MDGGNSFYKDDVRRAATLLAPGPPLRRRRHQRRDLGARARLLPDDRRRGRGGRRGSTRCSARSRRGRATIPRTPGPRDARRHRRARVPPLRPVGAGHFVKMIHNGIEYGLMQAYAEGFDILRERAVAGRCRAEHRYDLDARRTSPRSGGAGSVVGSWLLDLTAQALAESPTLAGVHRGRPGLGRGAMDRHGGDRGERPGRRALGVAVRRASARARSTPSPRSVLSAMRHKFGGHVERPSGGSGP